LYSAVVFTLNPLLQIYRQLFLFTLLAPKRVKKAQRRTKSVVTTFAHEFSQCENIPRSVAPCRQLPLDSRGMRKFGRASAARQKTCTSFPRLSAAVACDFNDAVFF
jgi:hypothetical protein